MLTGKGTKQFLRKSYLEDRRRALKDKRDFTNEELDRLHLDIKNGQGGGSTDPDRSDYWMQPYPKGGTGYTKKKKNVRDWPWIGW